MEYIMQQKSMEQGKVLLEKPVCKYVWAEADWCKLAQFEEELALCRLLWWIVTVPWGCWMC